MSPWQVLGVPRNATAADVRQRYAALIKQFRPDSHPEDFARIRSAYETALPLARELDARRAQEEQAPQAEPVPVQADVASIEPSEPPVARPSFRVVPEPMVVIDVAAPAPFRTQAPPEQAPAPQAQAAQRSLPELVAELRRRTDERGEEAALHSLRKLLARSQRVSLDERQSLEMELLRWFLRSQSPPLLLLFEAGRAFDWHGRELRLAPWIGPEDCDRLAALLMLARQAVFARHAASNVWVRRLFTPGGRVPWFGCLFPAVEARGWEAQWRTGVARAGLPALNQRLDPRALSRIHGRMVLSTDLLVGLLLTWIFGSVLFDELRAGLPWLSTRHESVFMLVMALLAGPAVAALRLLGRSAIRAWREHPRLEPLRRAAAWVRGHRYASLLAGGIALVLLIAANASGDMLLLDVVFFSLLAVGGFALAAFLLWITWHCMVLLERLAYAPFGWRESVDRWEFAQWLHKPAEPAKDDDRASPFGPRLAWWRRPLKIKEARAHEQGEVERHERPPRLRPVLRKPAQPGRTVNGRDAKSGINPWWLLWIGMIALRVISSMH